MPFPPITECPGSTYDIPTPDNREMKEMLKRHLVILLASCFLFSFALADPLTLTEDKADTVIICYNESDDSEGCYTYSYRYPCVDPEDPTAYLVNNYYEYLIKDTLDYTIPNLSEYYMGMHLNAAVDISYEITCNSDEFFSVKIHMTETVDGETVDTWQGNTFSRLNGMPGSVYSLPNLLGILDSGESDDFLESWQGDKAREAVWNLIWDMIQKNPDGIPYRPSLTKDNLQRFFDPELDFWLDETGNPVFFILPGKAADEDTGLLLFPITLEEIRDEM